MIRIPVLAALALGLVACGDSDTAPPPTPGVSATTAPPVGAASAAAPPAATAPSGATAAPASAPQAQPAAAAGLAGRSGELSNPDHSAGVFLYYDLAGITPPFDKWVEADNRVQFAPAPQKAALRTEVRAELEAAAAAVRDVGTLRITLNDARLSHYDPTYREFQVGALAPSSMVSYAALKQNVNVKFDNGKTAQIWRVTPEEAQTITDKLGPYGRAELDVDLAITGVVPGPGGGTINTRIVAFELRETRTGVTLGRLRP
jgi:hypothetical protein